MKLLGSALLLALTCSSCLFARDTINRPIAPTGVAQLQAGSSTAEDVVQLFGAPSDVVQLGRRSAYLYTHSIQKQSALFLIVFGLNNEDLRQDRLWVFFDEDNVLTHYGATFSADEASYEFPFGGEYETTQGGAGE
ncbi:MAG: outer membrane protein assembly factor BamE [Planctomycetota bacterium]